MCDISYVMLNCINKICLESKTYMFSSNTYLTCKWKHVAFVFLWLIFAKWNTLQVRLYCCIWQNFHSFLWLSSIYIYTTSSLSTYVWCALRLLLYLGYCKKVCTFLRTKWASCLNITELRFLSPCKLLLPHVIGYLDAKQRGEGGDVTEN